MEIRDNNSTLRIKLNALKKISNDNPIFIDTFVEIFVDYGFFKENIEIELLDFTIFLNNLKVLKEKLKREFYFGDLDELFQIKFIPQNNGNILINGILKDRQYVNQLNFSFQINPIQIDCLIRDVEIIIKNFN